MSNTTGIVHEMIEQARHADLGEYFKQNGYEIEQRRDELHIKGFGGLYINVDTNEWYCFTQPDKKGSKNAVNCLTDILGMDFEIAVSELVRYSYFCPFSYESISSPQTKQELVIPECVNNMRNVFV